MSAAAVRADSAAPLRLAFPAHAELRDPVTADFAVEDGILHARFEVRAPELNAKKVFGPKEYPYMFDAVELFVSTGDEATRASAPYFEFEVSPYDQIFNARIELTPRRVAHDGVDVPGYTHSAKLVDGGWSAELAIPLASLGLTDPARIVGNAYAILGRAPSRTYWSRSLPPESKPNFHRPEFFRPLVN